MTQIEHCISTRFRGFLPIVVDVETTGLDARTNGLLEIAAVAIQMNEQGLLYAADKIFHHVEPFAKAIIDQKSIEFLGIDPFHPFRFAIDEKTALEKIFEWVKQKVKENNCSRAILVGHNAYFDLSFIQAAEHRSKLKYNPFHTFTVLDTTSLAALAYGQTVLAKALQAAKLPYDASQAHSALYDAERTADLFCHIVNRWQHLVEQKTPSE